MAKVSIYIRTFKRDIAWLDFCLQSIHRNLKGWDEIVVCVPEGQAHHLRYLTSERCVTSPFFPVDYVGQQFAKLQAHRQVSGDYIFFVDADVVFLPGADVATFLDGDRPVIEKRRYTTLAAEGAPAVRWQAAVENLFHEPPTWEYMRNHGTRLFRTDTLRALGRRFPDLEGYARRVPRRLFSEFNFLGFFAEKNEPGRYVFVDTEASPKRQLRSRQFWTVDGLTPSTVLQLASLGLVRRWPSTLSPWDTLTGWASRTTRHCKQWWQQRKRP